MPIRPIDGGKVSGEDKRVGDLTKLYTQRKDTIVNSIADITESWQRFFVSLNYKVNQEDNIFAVIINDATGEEYKGQITDMRIPFSVILPPGVGYYVILYRDGVKIGEAPVAIAQAYDKRSIEFDEQGNLSFDDTGRPIPYVTRELIGNLSLLPTLNTGSVKMVFDELIRMMQKVTVEINDIEDGEEIFVAVSEGTNGNAQVKIAKDSSQLVFVVPPGTDCYVYLRDTRNRPIGNNSEMKFSQPWNCRNIVFNRDGQVVKDIQTASLFGSIASSRDIGYLPQLETNHKDTIVGAINEIYKIISP